MKIVVISDTHSDNKDIIDAILAMDKKIDMLIHLGDHADDGEKISKILGIPSIIVKGNCDYDSKYNDSELVELENKKIFLTHGHNYNVNLSLDRLYYEALEMGADIALYGHTHVPVNIVHDDIIIMNPGSPSLPRDGSNTKTFGIIEIGEKIKTEILSIF
ncbi:MAG: metallophosphoesterase [Tissierellaceae bacterium]|nr:metallophosphoesterase [Tissierellaceae bacterium]